MEIEANIQALINISRKRLCTQASVETRQEWEKVKEEVAKVDKDISNVMVPECIYRGFCPEMNCCGFVYTDKYKEKLEEYRNTIK